MNEDQKEELMQALEGARNFMLGMQLDPSIPTEQKQALIHKANELDAIIDKHLD